MGAFFGAKFGDQDRFGNLCDSKAALSLFIEKVGNYLLLIKRTLSLGLTHVKIVATSEVGRTANIDRWWNNSSRKRFVRKTIALSIVSGSIFCSVI